MPYLYGAILDGSGVNHRQVYEYSMSTAQKVTHGVMWSFVIRAAALATNFGLSIIIVRSLGTHDYGIFSLLKNIVVYVGLFCSLGLDSALLRYVPELMVHGNGHGLKATLVKVALAQLALTGLAVSLAYLLRGAVSDLYSLDLDLYLVGAACIAGLFALKSSLTQVFVALYRFRWLSLSIVGFSLFWIVSTVVSLRFDDQIGGVLLAQGTSFLVFAGLLLFGLRAELRVPLHLPSSVGNRRLLTYSGTSLVNSALNLVVQRQSEIFFVGLYLGAAAAGYYDLGYSLPQMALEIISTTVWSLGIVGFSEVVARDPSNLRRAIRWYYKLLALLLFPIATLGVLWADKMVVVMYGDRMQTAGHLAQAFSIIHLLFFASIPMATALWALEKAWVTIPFRVGSAILDIALAIVLVPRWGLAGAVAAVVITMVISTPVVLRICARVIGGWDIPWGYIIRCALASLPMGLLVPVRPYISSLFDLVGIALLSLGLFVIGIRVFSLIGPEERELMERSRLPQKEFFIKLLAAKSGTTP